MNDHLLCLVETPACCLHGLLYQENRPYPNDQNEAPPSTSPLSSISLHNRRIGSVPRCAFAKVVRIDDLHIRIYDFTAAVRIVDRGAVERKTG
jgi:hypothetical protein